jgi:hypothetical protein
MVRLPPHFPVALPVPRGQMYRTSYSFRKPMFDKYQALEMEVGTVVNIIHKETSGK